MKATLTFHKSHLTCVTLPAQPPVDLTTDTLRHLTTALAAHPLQYPIEASAFRRRVWDEMRKIPFGKTVTYQELAARVGHPRAARAVGSACAANQLLLVVPCHRVVARQGLGGFALGLEWKKRLLALENCAT